jgi:hypothetical protein
MAVEAMGDQPAFALSSAQTQLATTIGTFALDKIGTNAAHRLI